LHEYSAFTDDKFTKIAYTTSYSYHDAITAWKAITAELTRLGEVTLGIREMECAEDAGEIGCLLIDYTKDDNACEWAHTLETVVGEVAKKCNADWVNKFNSFLDVLRKATCEEPNDCESGAHNCDENATCKPKQAVYGKTTSGFKCHCNEGYYGNGKTCFPDVDECTEGIHKCSTYATCKDTQTGYTCHCINGYVGNGYICSIPVDECEEGTHDCDVHAKCIDLPNGYQCKCDATTGYYGNGKVCNGPADECLDGTHTCHAAATCTNTYAGFTCACPKGWYGNGYNCWPPLTCPWKNDDYENYPGDFDNGLCSLKYSKICTNTLYADMVAAGATFCSGNYAMQQFNIFIHEMFSFGKIYEKKYGIATSHITDASYDRYGAECSPDAGAVPCDLINFHNVVDAADLFARVKALFDHVFAQCSPTYKAKWEQWLARYHNALICPVNECKNGEATCHEYASCTDLAMGYDCTCKRHYEGDGKTTCTPIDYCSQNNICPMYATCTNLNPNYKCTCVDGYYKYGNKCVAIDPCTVNNGGCDTYAKCRSWVVGNGYNHVCECNRGYFGDGFTCEPIDPCAENNCNVNARCIPYSVVHTAADYNCKCNAGYSGNGFVCKEIVDPCQGRVCHEHAKAKVVSLYGQQSCICECNKGYSGNGQNCVPTNPCTNNDCSQHATCTAVGSTLYKCTCKAGYSGDGKTCTYIDPCDDCSPHATCNSYTKVCACKTGYVGDGFVCRVPDGCARPCPSGTSCDDGDCMCRQSGYVYNFNTYRCEDDNECSSGRNNCHEHANCQNRAGGFRCTCKQGYTGDGVSCNKNNQNSGYQQGGNPYAQDQAVAEPTKNPNPDGLDVSIYSEISPGQCSVMGYDWENLNKMLYKFKWASGNKNLQIQYVNEIFKQFATLGKSALARSGPSCDPKLAGVVPCNILYFPHTEHRCQAVKRMAKVFHDVAQHCNSSWKTLFGGKMNYLLQNNKSGKHGAACERVVWLN
jgi:hypothetical protein